LIVVARWDPPLLEVRSTSRRENQFALEVVKDWLGIKGQLIKVDMHRPEFIEPFLKWIDSITGASMFLHGRKLGYVKYAGKKTGEIRQDVRVDSLAATEIVDAAKRGNIFSGIVEMKALGKNLNLKVNFKKGRFASSQIHDEEMLSYLISEMYKIAVGAKIDVKTLDDF